jgi:hypothetical protein
MPPECRFGCWKEVDQLFDEFFGDLQLKAIGSPLTACQMKQVEDDALILWRRIFVLFKLILKEHICYFGCLNNEVINESQFPTDSELLQNAYKIFVELFVKWERGVEEEIS